MKKGLFLPLMIVLLVAMLVACGGPDAENQPITNDNASATTEASEPEVTTDSIVGSWAVVGREDISQDEFEEFFDYFGFSPLVLHFFEDNTVIWQWVADQREEHFYWAIDGNSLTVETVEEQSELTWIWSFRFSGSNLILTPDADTYLDGWVEMIFERTQPITNDNASATTEASEPEVTTSSILGGWEQIGQDGVTQAEFAEAVVELGGVPVELYFFEDGTGLIYQIRERWHVDYGHEVISYEDIITWVSTENTLTIEDEWGDYYVIWDYHISGDILTIYFPNEPGFLSRYMTFNRVS